MSSISQIINQQSLHVSLLEKTPPLVEFKECQMNIQIDGPMVYYTYIYLMECQEQGINQISLKKLRVFLKYKLGNDIKLPRALVKNLAIGLFKSN